MIRLRYQIYLIRRVRSKCEIIRCNSQFISSYHTTSHVIQNSIRLPSQKSSTHLSLKASICHFKRHISTLNLEKAPTKEFLASFLDQDFNRTNQLIFNEKFQILYLASLEKKDHFTMQEINELSNDFYRVTQASFEFAQGFRFINAFLSIVNCKTINESTKSLKYTIFSQRDLLLKFVLYNGYYNFFQENIAPQIISTSNKSFLDQIIPIIKLQRKTDGEVNYDTKSFSNYLTKSSLKDSREMINLLILNKYNLDSSYESKLSTIRLFLKYTKMVEGEEWLKDETITAYDELLKLIGIPPKEVFGVETFLQDLTQIAEQLYDTKTSYYFITQIMKNLVSKSPYLTYLMFQFKSSEIRHRNLRRTSVLNKFDLAYVMEACLSFDENKIYELYMQNRDLHDDESQESVFLQLCVEHKDWKSLQSRFENMYGKGNLPDTIHYGITMQALEFLGADSELERLYEQILERKLSMNSVIFIARMKANIRQKDQNELFNVLQEYIYLALNGRAYQNDIKFVFPFVLELYIQEQDYKSVLDIIKIYSEKEKEFGLEFVSPKVLSDVSKILAENCSIAHLEQLFEIASTYHKLTPEFMAGIIDCYTRLGQFSKADSLAYQAHSRSSPPFSNLQIYASQFNNYTEWERSIPQADTKRYIEMKLEYIASSILKTHFSIFQIQAGGIPLLSDVMDYLQKKAKNHSRINALSHLKGREVKTFYNLIKSSKHYHIRTDEELYLPILRSNLIYENYKPLNVMKIFKEMNSDKILLSAKSYTYFMKAIMFLDKKYDRRLKNTSDLLRQMLESYGFYDDTNRFNPKLNFKKDSLLIADIIIKYVETVGIRQGNALFNKFVYFCEDVYNDKLPIPLKAKIDKQLRRSYKQVNKVEYEMFMEQNFTFTEKLLNQYLEQVPSNSIIPPVLNNSMADILIQRMKHWIETKSFTQDHKSLVLDTLLKGIKLNIVDYNYLFSKFLEDPSNNFHTVMTLIERNLIQGNLTQIDLYKEKKLCYKICLVYLGDNFGDELVEENYKILSDYYGVRTISEERGHLKVDGLNFLRSSSGRLFNIRLDPYGSRTMNQFNFIDYFNPARELTNELKLFNNTSRLLMKTISTHIKNTTDSIKILKEKYPKIMSYYTSDLSYYKNLTIFNGKIDYLNSSNDPRIRRSKDVLKELLFNYNKAKIFISKDATFTTKIQKDQD
ncbi:hypothetical protein KGF54_004072 [Candida jiufengensis]|uniref:uncharacterized protein n=1 Tax=Candida jiufengensis TaxID=497108 RepID=UPI002224927A|nr:uncharacterized protein KGF54_004072 [Candida jiufengensis]KAI5950998.1 hypothetical protein KGF54_004072 [Candida jiufengensis]